MKGFWRRCGLIGCWALAGRIGFYPFGTARVLGFLALCVVGGILLFYFEEYIRNEK